MAGAAARRRSGVAGEGAKRRPSVVARTGARGGGGAAAGGRGAEPGRAGVPRADRSGGDAGGAGKAGDDAQAPPADRRAARRAGRSPAGAWASMRTARRRSTGAPVPGGDVTISIRSDPTDPYSDVARHAAAPSSLSTSPATRSPSPSIAPSSRRRTAGAIRRGGATISTAIRTATRYEFGRFGNHPAVYVSWFDAVAFCRWLSRRLGFYGAPAGRMGMAAGGDRR